MKSMDILIYEFEEMEKIIIFGDLFDSISRKFRIKIIKISRSNDSVTSQ